MALPKTIGDLSLASVVSAGAYIPVFTGGLTKATSLSALSIGADLFNVKDPRFGAIGDGSTDDSTAIQAAIDSGNGIFIPSGIYAIGTTLNVTSKSGFHFKGVAGGGATMTTGQAVLKWTGGAGGVMISCTGTRDSLFESFNITVGNAPSTLSAAIDFDPTGRTQAETNNVFRDIGIVQLGGATTPDNSLAIGIRLSRSNSPGNVDEFEFHRIAISGCSSAGISIEDSQCRGHTFFHSSITFCTRGITTVLADDGGGFSVFGGNFGANSIADFVVGTFINYVKVYNVHSENSARLYKSTNGANSSVAILFSGVTVAGSSALAADGQVIQNGDASAGGYGGPLIVEGCDFYGADNTVAAKLGFNMSNGNIILIGNSWNNTSPVVLNGGSGPAHLIAIGQRGWDGAAFVDITNEIYSLTVTTTATFASTVSIDAALNVSGITALGSTVSIGGACVVSLEGRFGHTTTAGAANAYIDATSKLLQRSTSSLRYKELEGSMGLAEAQNIIFNAEPINFKSKNDGSRHFGFAAEWMHKLDERTVVPYEGRPDWVEYPILTAPLTKVAQDHEERLKALEDLLKK